MPLTEDRDGEYFGSSRSFRRVGALFRTLTGFITPGHEDAISQEDSHHSSLSSAGTKYRKLAADDPGLVTLLVESLPSSLVDNSYQPLASEPGPNASASNSSNNQSSGIDTPSGWRRFYTLFHPFLAKLLLISPFFFWGTSMVALKTVLPILGPFTVAAIRLLPAGILLAVTAAAKRRPMPSTARSWFAILIFGIVDAAMFQGFLAEGLRTTSAGLGSVIIDSQPLTVALFAALLFHESLPVTKVLGLLLGMVGITVLSLGVKPGSPPTLVLGADLVPPGGLSLTPGMGVGAGALVHHWMGAGAVEGVVPSVGAGRGMGMGGRREGTMGRRAMMDTMQDEMVANHSVAKGMQNDDDAWIVPAREMYNAIDRDSAQEQGANVYDAVSPHPGAPRYLYPNDVFKAGPPVDGDASSGQVDARRGRSDDHAASNGAPYGGRAENSAAEYGGSKSVSSNIASNRNSSNGNGFAGNASSKIPPLGGIRERISDGTPFHLDPHPGEGEGIGRVSLHVGASTWRRLGYRFLRWFGSGESWMLAAAQSMAAGTLMFRWVCRGCDPIMATAWHMVIGALVLILLAHATGEPLFLHPAAVHVSLRDIAALSYCSVFGAAASYGVFFYFANKGDLVRLSSLTFLTPVFAASFGFLLLKETLTHVQLLGCLVTVVAVVLVNHKKRTPIANS
eukprot:jgi/Mesvir1/29307/Mv01567-RA.1